MHFTDDAKGHLISKGHFDAFKSIKKTRNFCKDFFGFLVDFKTPKCPFEINWPLVLIYKIKKLIWEVYDYKFLWYSDLAKNLEDRTNFKIPTDIKPPLLSDLSEDQDWYKAKIKATIKAIKNKAGSISPTEACNDFDILPKFVPCHHCLKLFTWCWIWIIILSLKLHDM